MAIDLKKYGLNWSLDADSSVAMPIDFAKRVNNASITNDSGGPVILDILGDPDEGPIDIDLVGMHISFTGVKSDKYTFDRKIGDGSFGTVYSCYNESDGQRGVIKIVRDTKLSELIKEALVQIIIIETTKDKKYPDIHLYGPYAPLLYNFAYDASTKTGFIVSQELRTSARNMLDVRRGQDKELRDVINLIMIQSCTIISDLYKSLDFNHRDFKADNFMYFRDTDSRVQFRLIDFGYSYIKYKNVSISCDKFRHSVLPTRDMTQFMYSLAKQATFLPEDTKSVLASLLTFRRGRSTCFLLEGCGSKMQHWYNTYQFMNTVRVNNPNGRVEVVLRVFTKFAKGLDYRSELAWVPKSGCPDSKPFYNPKTRRCSKLPVAAKANIKAWVCQKNKPNFNPYTKRCSKACIPGKKRSKNTFKCV